MFVSRLAAQPTTVLIGNTGGTIVLGSVFITNGCGHLILQPGRANGQQTAVIVLPI